MVQSDFRPVVNDQEYLKTKTIVDHFGKRIGLVLDKQLQEKARQERNWASDILSKWWDEEIYLKWRQPLAPKMNMVGYDSDWSFWPPKDNSQIERVALQLHFYGQIFQSIRQIFSLFYILRLENDGRCPTHIVIIRKRRFFVFDLFDDENILTPPEIEYQLHEIVKLSEKQTNNAMGLGALTALPRDDWALIREHFCEIDSRNELGLNLIEESLMIYSLEDKNVDNLTDLCKLVMLGDPVMRWFDKSIVVVVTQNGVFGSNCDHTVYEGLIPLQINENVHKQTKFLNGVWNKQQTHSAANPKTNAYEIIFYTDQILHDAIERGRELFFKEANDYDCITTTVPLCTKMDITKKINVHPDTYFQLCLQLGYYQLHHRAAPTYETASTRRYYKGRTETCRTCTSEVIQWCKAMVDEKNVTDGMKRKLFLIAVKRHRQLMTEASSNEGCDRHLFGLSMLATEKGYKFTLDDDPSWKKSGGGGNFILSTSCLGFRTTCGGTAPMCSTGYGVFYRIGPDATAFFISAYHSCPETSASALSQSITDALINVKSLFANITSNL
ncbi:unnamed protein product [Didymodactylos carnosus]|uniref:Choline/carnitine acyltransferase domain-containing protein n=1 Tax=Didymodactylos carnosus TaxID=1234261 RepID=A0A8S2D4E4_9BILA|nr:unnamed protein product [Didymodactylos carnosus]CAF3593865.1 unnamed protein product [Didymodactylos carnosus]